MATPGTALFHRILRLCTSTTAAQDYPRGVCLSRVTEHAKLNTHLTILSKLSNTTHLPAEFRQTLSCINRSLLAELILWVEIGQITVSVKIRIPGKISPASSGNYVTLETLNKISEELTSFSLHKIRLFRSRWFLVSFLPPGSSNK